MANIGSFKKSGQEFQGEIVTLSLQTKGVRIVPETDRTNDNAPIYANLFDDEDAETYTLIWSRSRKPNGD